MWFNFSWTVYWVTWLWLNCLLVDLTLADLYTGWPEHVLGDLALAELSTAGNLEFARTSQSLKKARQASTLVRRWCNCYKGNCHLIHSYISVIITDGWCSDFTIQIELQCFWSFNWYTFCIKALTIMIINLHCLLSGDYVVFRHSQVYCMTASCMGMIYSSLHCYCDCGTVAGLPCSASDCGLSGFCVILQS